MSFAERALHKLGNYGIFGSSTKEPTADLSGLLGKFTPIIGPTCQECGRASRQETCEDCQVWLGEGYPPLKNQALFKYDAMMHDFFQQYKFRGGYHLRTIFQEALQKRLAEVSVDMIVPIPVSPDTLAMRGFNQVNGLLEICEIDDILCCISHNKSVQSLKTRQIV